MVAKGWVVQRLNTCKRQKENLWLVNGITWVALEDVDDDEGEKLHLPDDDSDDSDDGLPRATNDFGLACLVTLDSATLLVTHSWRCSIIRGNQRIPVIQNMSRLSGRNKRKSAEVF